MIKIIDIQMQLTELGVNHSRVVDIIISNGTTHYHLGVGGLSLTGDLQKILNAREEELWRVAQEKDDQLDTQQVRRRLYNSAAAGGWTHDEFQEALFEKEEGNPTKLNILKDRRATIRADWPIS